VTERYLILGAALFAIGLYGMIARRNLLIVLMSLELMLNAVNLTFVAYARQLGNLDGHVFFLMVMAVAAAEIAVGLSIVIAIFRLKRSVDTAEMSELKG
jgi:NADH-quinone oxidoreductase subunit K